MANIFNSDTVIASGGKIQGTLSTGTVVDIATPGTSGGVTIGNTNSSSGMNIYGTSYENPPAFAPGGLSDETFALTGTNGTTVTPNKVGATSGSEYGYYIEAVDGTTKPVLVGVASSSANAKYFGIGDSTLNLIVDTTTEINDHLLLNNAAPITHSSNGNLVSIDGSSNIVFGSSDFTSIGNCHLYIAENTTCKIRWYQLLEATTTSGIQLLVESGYSGGTYVNFPTPTVLTLASRNVTPVYSNYTSCITLNSTYVTAVAGGGIIKMRGLKMIVINLRFTIAAIAANTAVTLATINKTNYQPATLTDLSVYSSVAGAHVVAYCSTAGVITLKSDVALASGGYIYVSGIAYIT